MAWWGESEEGKGRLEDWHCGGSVVGLFRASFRNTHFCRIHPLLEHVPWLICSTWSDFELNSGRSSLAAAVCCWRIMKMRL